MAWVKLDDRFPDHPKVAAAGPLAGWLYVCALAYANRMGTEGFVPAGMVGRLADIDGAAEHASRLVAVGLWEPAEGGYRIHDYHDYQPTREHAETVSQARAEAGRAGGIRSGEAREAKTKQIASPLLADSRSKNEANGEAKSKPVPDPVPVPQESLPSETVGSTYMAPAAPRGGPETVKPPRYSKPFDAFWAAYPSQDGRAWPKPATYAIWQRLKPDGELADAILAGVTAWLQGRDWQRGYIMRPDRWLKERSWEEPPEPWSGIDEAAVRAPPSAPTRYSANHIDTAQAARDFDLARNGGYANGQHPGPAPGPRIVPRQLAPPLPGP